MVRARTCQEIRHQCSGLGHPLLVPRLSLESIDHLRVLVVVGGVIAGHGGDTARVSFLIPIDCRFAVASRVTVGLGCLGHHLGDVNTAAEAVALREVMAWSSRDTFKGVFARHVRGALVEWCAGLVVWQIRLSRVGEKRQDSGDPLGRASLAGGDHYEVPSVNREGPCRGAGVNLTDAGLYEVVVDLVFRVLGAGGLDDIYILPTNSLLDLASALTD